jgi:NTP pyrophosphatase (non-canonical NTP hydrolase)
MTINDLIEDVAADTAKWFGEFNLTVTTLGLVGEAGEFADELKKVMRGSKTFPDALPRLREELIDLFIYVCAMAKFLNMDLVEEYMDKKAFNEERFGAGRADSSN